MLMMRRAVSDSDNCGVLANSCQFGIVHPSCLLLDRPFAEPKPSFSHNFSEETPFQSHELD